MRKTMTANLPQQTAPKLDLTCPNCGELGQHWVAPVGFLSNGFWTCPMLYGDDGRRLEP